MWFARRTQTANLESERQQKAENHRGGCEQATAPNLKLTHCPVADGLRLSCRTQALSCHVGKWFGGEGVNEHPRVNLMVPRLAQRRLSIIDEHSGALRTREHGLRPVGGRCHLDQSL